MQGLLTGRAPGLERIYQPLGLSSWESAACMTRVLRVDELEELKRARRRLGMAAALAMRSTTKRRTSRRRINDAIRLARLAVLAAETYLEVVRWGRTGEERILRLRDSQ